MCGIITIVKNKKNNSEEILNKMLATIKHRGPDHTGKFVNDNISYGMTRLSIIDLHQGEQPIFMKKNGEEFSIVFNGEIYNYQKLKKELEKENFVFKTNSDTEVILALYIKYRDDPQEFLLKLRGMFSFSIFDQEKQEIFVARDFFGIKPCYYFKKENSIFAFGSEIKALLLHPEYRKELNTKALRNYLSFQYNPLEETFFKNIFKLKPGHFIKIKQNSGDFKIEKYFDFKFLPKKLSKKEAQNKTFNILEDSVRHHLVSDVPVGTFLSGGIDSAITTAFVRKLKPDLDLHTFTIGGEENNEFSKAKKAAEFLKTKHTEIRINKKEYFKLLPKMIWHLDEPLADPSAYALYFLSREARKKVKVVLSGEGADELFGGYGIYREARAVNLIRNAPFFIKHPILLLKKLPFNFFGKNYLRRVSQSVEDRYIGNAYIFKKEEIRAIWKKEILPDFFDLSFLYKKVNTVSDSIKMQYIDMNTWLVGDILQKGDKMSMANSLEVRVPFLDYQVANFAKTIPDNLKYTNGKTKYLLRDLVAKLLPKVEKRKRSGFPIPLKKWLQEEKDWIGIINNSPLIKEFFNFKIIKQIEEEFLSEKKDNSRKIFLLLVLAIWYDEYFIKK